MRLRVKPDRCQVRGHHRSRHRRDHPDDDGDDGDCYCCRPGDGHQRRQEYPPEPERLRRG
jgi:hypothetical protein